MLTDKWIDDMTLAFEDRSSTYRFLRSQWAAQREELLGNIDRLTKENRSFDSVVRDNYQEKQRLRDQGESLRNALK